LTTTPQAGLRTTDPGVIHFDIAVQRLPIRVDHRAPQFVQQQHPRGLVSPQAELSLEDERRQYALVGHPEVNHYAIDELSIPFPECT